jgi:hypothetical protein
MSIAAVLVLIADIVPDIAIGEETDVEVGTGNDGAGNANIEDFPDSLENPPPPPDPFWRAIYRWLLRLAPGLEALRRFLEPSPRTDPDDDEDEPELIYRVAPRPVKDLSIHLPRNWLTGLSFQVQEPPATARYVTFRVSVLRANGFVVQFDGNTISRNIWTGEPYIDPYNEDMGLDPNAVTIYPVGHVTVYHSSKQYWDAWHEADVANLNTQNISPQLAWFASLREAP